MTRIGIDARLLGYRKGGIAEYTRQLIEGLAPLNADHTYLILHRFSDQQQYVPGPNFKRINIYTPAHHRFERIALSLELLPRQLDLLHSPDFIAPRQGARKHIITIHDLHFLHYPEFQTAESLRYYRDQITHAVQHADHILAQTEGTRQEIISMLKVPSEKITVHLLGVHASFRVLESESVLAILSGYRLPPAYILFVGTVEPRKNLVRLIDAYLRLKTEWSDVPPLVIVGQKGWQSDQITSAIEQADDVIWLQNVPFSDLPAIYNGASLLVLPSFHEGFGLPAVEAMACGTPVVISERGSLPEVVADTGVYIDPDDTDSIADGMRQVLQDSELTAQLRNSGLKRAAQFSWQHTAEIALQVYQQILET